jgi:hypothetical protein
MLQIFGLENREESLEIHHSLSTNFFQVQGRKTQVMPYAVTDEFSEKWLKSIIFTSFTELQESLLKLSSAKEIVSRNYINVMHF